MVLIVQVLIKQKREKEKSAGTQTNIEKFEGLKGVDNGSGNGRSPLIILKNGTLLVPSMEATPFEPLIQDAYGPYHCCQDRVMSKDQ